MTSIEIDDRKYAPSSKNPPLSYIISCFAGSLMAHGYEIHSPRKLVHSKPPNQHVGLRQAEHGIIRTCARRVVRLFFVKVEFRNGGEVYDGWGAPPPVLK